MASTRILSGDGKPSEGIVESNVVIIGGGIVGSAIAAYLGEAFAAGITVIDTSLNQLRGSTGQAPGLIGQLNELPILTQLAKTSLRDYSKIPGGFDAVGGLEIASEPHGIAILERRCRLAHDAGIPAQMLKSAEAARMAPQWHKEDSVSKALYFSGDGTANPKEIVHEYRRTAKLFGVAFIEAEVLSIMQEKGEIVGIMTSTGLIKAGRVVVATGIWAAQLLEPLGIHLPIIPVAHPYVYGPERPHRDQSAPFVRWPQHHVYARDHGSYDGFGSYDHPPVAVEKLHSTAIASWELSFDTVVANAASLFLGDVDMGEMRCFNGIFAVTPDGLPLAGQLRQLRGLWVASAVWITHASGIARLITDMMNEKMVDKDLSSAVDPNRFSGQDAIKLRSQALSTYNNIYNLSE